MANYLKISLIVVCIIVLLQMVNTVPQVSFVRKCKEIDHTIYLKPSSVLKCPEEESVNLSGLNLPKIPVDFIRSLTIENILLDGNNIEIIPDDAFKYVPKLKCINLSRNRISYDWLLFKQPSLKTLILDYQTFDEFHVSTYNMGDLSEISSNFPNLEILSVRGNGMMSVDISSNTFPQLSILYLSHNNIQYIDPVIFQEHPQLKNLHLEGNNIKILNLEDALSLEELYLDGNPIEKLEVSSFKQSLKVLSLSNCFLKNPMFISSPLLITLDMSGNQIINIDDNAFENTTLLENLSLMHNYITFFPNLSYLKQLKRLFLSYNNISTLRRNSMPDGLKILSLKGNQIQQLDETAFENLKILEELDLSFNKLETFLVGEQDNLRTLRHLNLMWNRFTTIDSMEIVMLTSLKELCVANNFIGSIDLNSLQVVPQECTVYVLNNEVIDEN